jgi:hypothetical protein
MLPTCKLHFILSFTLVVLILFICYYEKNTINEYFKETQYMIKYKDAVENHNFGPSTENCINDCKQLNSNLEDQARCITYCGLHSGFIPYEEMIPNGEILYNYL